MDADQRLPGSGRSIHAYLRGIRFPLDKAALIDALERNGAPEEVFDRVRDVDATHFAGPDDVLAAIDTGFRLGDES